MGLSYLFLAFIVLIFTLLPTTPQTFNKYCNWTREVATDDYKLFSDDEKKKYNIHPKWEYYSDRTLIEQDCTGDKNLKALIESLNRFDKLGFQRSKQQVLFHKTFISAILKLLYGQDIYKHIGRLLEEYELDELRPDVIVCTPRRFGKTTSVALFVAALLWTQAGFSVDIYSTGRRASRKLLALIYKMVLLLSGSDNVVVTYNQETLEIKTPSGVTSVCNSYPSKVQINSEAERLNATPCPNPIFYPNSFRISIFSTDVDRDLIMILE
jgi:hypothetical protein